MTYDDWKADIRNVDGSAPQDDDEMPEMICPHCGAKHPDYDGDPLTVDDVTDLLSRIPIGRFVRVVIQTRDGEVQDAFAVSLLRDDQGRPTAMFSARPITVPCVPVDERCAGR
jgi:hypothetical protein